VTKTIYQHEKAVFRQENTLARHRTTIEPYLPAQPCVIYNSLYITSNLTLHAHKTFAPSIPHLLQFILKYIKTLYYTFRIGFD
jgi:hypothetical protein